MLNFLDIKLTVPQLIINQIQNKMNSLKTNNLQIFIDGGCSGANKTVSYFNLGSYRSDNVYSR